MKGEWKWRGNAPIFVFSRINYSEMNLQIPLRTEKSQMRWRAAEGGGGGGCGDNTEEHTIESVYGM